MMNAGWTGKRLFRRKGRQEAGMGEVGVKGHSQVISLHTHFR